MLPSLKTLVSTKLRSPLRELSNAVSIVSWVPGGGNPQDSRLDQYLPAPELSPNPNPNSNPNPNPKYIFPILFKYISYLASAVEVATRAFKPGKNIPAPLPERACASISVGPHVHPPLQKAMARPMCWYELR